MNRDENEHRPPSHHHQQQQRTAMNYQFSPEEIKVLKECNKESFFQRCIPLSAFLGFSTYYGVKNGFFTPNSRYGATPKVIVAIIVGYFLGKFSYQGKCAEKLMQLPNSRFGEILRQKRKGVYHESLDSGFGSGLSLAPFSSVSPTDTYSDVSPSSDIDTSRPDYNGLDDLQRPSVDNPIYDEEMPPVQKHTTTYEELRKKNREEYQQKRTSGYRDPPMPSTPTSQQEKEGGETVQVRTNKYGDTWT